MSLVLSFFRGSWQDVCDVRFSWADSQRQVVRVRVVKTGALVSTNGSPSDFDLAVGQLANYVRVLVLGIYHDGDLTDMQVDSIFLPCFMFRVDRVVQELSSWLDMLVGVFQQMQPLPFSVRPHRAVADGAAATLSMMSTAEPSTSWAPSTPDALRTPGLDNREQNEDH